MQIKRGIARLQEAGARAIVPGRTEFGLIVEDRRLSVPIYDTLRIHATAATQALWS